MTAALPVQVALVDDTKHVAPTELAQVAGALNEQVARDFGPTWHVKASVVAYTEAPPWTWTIHLQDKLDDPGALGFHIDNGLQPVAYVERTFDWPTTVSHELLEMLADPWGNRMHSGRLPDGVEDHYADFGLKTKHSHVRYLLEVADPCEATSYDIGGVQVSDFLRPAWYHANRWSGDKYSHAGGCRKPREVAENGYVSFAAGDHEWFQVMNQGGRLSVRDIGRFDRASWSSLREFTDHAARKYRANR